MKLKKIRMIGFKSFADETQIETQDGITAIVGPNGCGKSNIMDAVRWVLGEKSAKDLRAKSMDDVIFLGSEFRKPAGMAEVELIFDNSDRSLPVDQEEVLVGRRIFLNSGSEYLLNGRRTTRREIERVFMDTGVGKSAYSIMGQGRMAEILRAAPEDRRQLFDEAAGISRFKSDREETMKRLAETDQNLLRLNDILKSKEDELKGLERQARKTREYQKLKSVLDERDRALRYIKYGELQERREKVHTKLEKLNQKREEVFQRIRQVEETSEDMGKKNEAETEEMHRLDREYHRALSEMESVQTNISRIESEQEQQNSKLKSLEERSQSEENKCQEIQERMKQAQQLELNLNEEITALEGTSQKLESEIKRLRAIVDETHTLEEKFKEELVQLEEAQSALLEELKSIAHELIEELDTHKRELQETESSRVALRDTILQKLEETASSIAELSSNLTGEERQAALAKIDINAIIENFQKYEKFEGEFRAFFFGRSGLLSKKEGIDRKIDENLARREEIQQSLTGELNRRKQTMTLLEKESGRKVEVDLQVRDAQTRRTTSAAARENISDLLNDARERLSYYQTEIKEVSEQSENLKKEAVKLTGELAELKQKNSEQFKTIAALREKVEKNRATIKSHLDSARRDREYLENTLPELTELERRSENYKVAIGTIEENLYNDHQLSLGELESQFAETDLDSQMVEDDFRRLRSEIQSLGQFNPMAIEELERSQEIYNQINEQKNDVNSAREDILNILKEIDEKSKVRFMDTFQSIQNNFSQVFQTLFGGGDANLTLTEPEDPLNSGVDIMVHPPGKKNTLLSLLSGGEQSLTAIALMFATYLVRPSPFCFLDEIDAPLDDNNVNRFLRMLSGFAQRSQFLVITHNKLTMARASGIFGVTQEELGISKLVSVKLSHEQTQNQN